LRVTGSLKPISEKEYLTSAEEMPMPVGGLYSIQSKIKYPEIAKRAGIEGKVFVQAFIDENGNVTEAKVIKGIGTGCDEAALNAVKSTKFTPGKQKGIPVKVQVSIPIMFKLE
jgi:protein TonB